MTAHSLAHWLRDTLAPACQRIEIAGSIRRGKPNPRDIEIVCIPDLELRQDTDMFGNPVGKPLTISMLEYCLERETAVGAWDYDRVVKRNGPRYKRLRHIETGICADLFIVSLDTWGAQLVIRTGPADFSKELVTRALRRGMQQDGGLLWRTHRDGTRDVIETPTEEAYFKALGLAYIEPEKRNVAALKATV